MTFRRSSDDLEFRRTGLGIRLGRSEAGRELEFFHAEFRHFFRRLVIVGFAGGRRLVLLVLLAVFVLVFVLLSLFLLLVRRRSQHQSRQLHLHLALALTHKRECRPRLARGWLDCWKIRKKISKLSEIHRRTEWTPSCLFPITIGKPRIIDFRRSFSNGFCLT